MTVPKPPPIHKVVDTTVRYQPAHRVDASDAPPAPDHPPIPRDMMGKPL